MSRSIAGFFVSFLLILGVALPGECESKYSRKLNDAREVVVEAMNAPGKAIPPALLRNCKAIAIFPGTIKAGFIVAGRYGEGIVMTRDTEGKWSAPAFFTIAGGSYGLQIGIQSMDVVLLIMNDRGLQALLKQKFTIGADVAVTAGPASVSGDADIDVFLKADILSYTRSKGLFAGLAVNGARMAASPNMNREFYGRKISVDEIIIHRSVDAPAAASLKATLETYAK